MYKKEERANEIFFLLIERKGDWERDANIWKKGEKIVMWVWVKEEVEEERKGKNLIERKVNDNDKCRRSWKWVGFAKE